MTASQVIKLLNLQPLEGEGGYFRRTYESKDRLGTRFCATAIYYLVTPESFSSLHRLPQDELFHFYLGDTVEMLRLSSDGKAEIVSLGFNLEAGDRPQVLVPGGLWQGTRLRKGGKWALLGCTVVPGYEHADNEVPTRAQLLALFPSQRDLIMKYTHD